MHQCFIEAWGQQQQQQNWNRAHGFRSTEPHPTLGIPFPCMQVEYFQVDNTDNTVIDRKRNENMLWWRSRQNPQFPRKHTNLRRSTVPKFPICQHARRTTAQFHTAVQQLSTTVTPTATPCLLRGPHWKIAAKQCYFLGSSCIEALPSKKQT